MYIFGFSTNYIRVKTVPLTHVACTHCHHKGLVEMTLLQEEQDGVVTQRLNKLSATVTCTSCNQSISKNNWRPEITAAFNAAVATVKLTTSVKFSKQGKRVIGIFLGCIVFVVEIFAADKLGILKNSGKQAYEIGSDHTEQYIRHPQSGDICQVGIFDAHAGANAEGKYTLFKIVTTDKANNTIVMIPHTGQVASPNDFGGLSIDAGSFDAAHPETFVLKEFEYHHFKKENEGSGGIARNIYSIKRPAK
ncbi:hypothetical protein [Chitinophaga sp. RAB17]|uniref:hypothetical protein n=1 Tax=Chitinophaga sp. RAB17 TaxID=3233049 RepID=UPI003F931A5C